ncbi:hypothetical protein EYF80_027301 [Liparis tanakae]|uniref:Uncharacterized protein n=1 Tax=Liparis tanakae TaxID=230148 RepID=A0A4Z2H9E6_9TELE|nr:hypothetical protein EYF80_027301 [Liparis tanakae]
MRSLLIQEGTPMGFLKQDGFNMKVVSCWQSERRRGPQVTRPRLKGDAEQTEQPEGRGGPGCGRRCCGYQQPANLCTPSVPPQGHAVHRVCQRGKRVSRPGATGATKGPRPAQLPEFHFTHQQLQHKHKAPAWAPILNNTSSPTLRTLPDLFLPRGNSQIALQHTATVYPIAGY